MLERSIGWLLVANGRDEGDQLALVELLAAGGSRLDEPFASGEALAGLLEAEADPAAGLERLEQDRRAAPAVDLEAARHRTRLHRRDIDGRDRAAVLEDPKGVVG